MKIVYIAHPISGDVAVNIVKVDIILEKIFEFASKKYFPIAPYLHACTYLDDTKSEDRERAMDANFKLLKSGYVNQLWFIADKPSPGMCVEIDVALANGIKTMRFGSNFTKYSEDQILRQLRTRGM